MESRAIPGTHNRDRAEVRRDPLRQRARDAWRSASGQKHWDRSHLRRRAAAARDCDRLLAWCHALERWLSHGLWTNWDRSAVPWRIARWCWMRSTARTDKTSL